MSRCVFALVALVWLFTSVNSEMSVEIAFLRSCVVALVALVWLFTRVNSDDMTVQIAFLRSYIVALVALVCSFACVHFFSRVSFHVFPQMPCINRCKVALAALV